MGLVNAKLDDIDFQILTYLQQDGRKSFTDISQEMGVSVGMVRNRYQRLVKDKVLHIIGWTDPVKSGFHAYARVNIKVRPIEMLDSVVVQLSKIPEISFLALTSGDFDIEINTICRDNKHFLDIAREKIRPIKGVFDSNTTMYLDVLKWALHDVTNS